MIRAALPPDLGPARGDGACRHRLRPAFTSPRCDAPSTLFTAGRGWVGPLALTLARIAAAVIFLGLAAKLGAAALIAAFLGFLLARTVMLRVARRAD